MHSFIEFWFIMQGPYTDGVQKNICSDIVGSWNCSQAFKN